MSGRDHEPIAAFFPPIDRNLIRDLDRHLRGTARQEQPDEDERPADAPAQLPAPAQASPHPPRPRTSEVLEAVQQAASSMAAMSQRIQDLEARQVELDAVNAQLREKLGEILQIQQASDARARAEAERANRAETIAAQHLSRAQTLENDLEAALGDLHRIAEAITGTLAVQHQQ